jgi:hypothetical protein
MKLNCACGMLLAALPLAVTGLAPRHATAQPPQPEPPAIPADQFVKLHVLIRPQPGELRFHEIPWLIDVWEARKQAAAEGKPILVWSGAGGAPIGVC